MTIFFELAFFQSGRKAFVNIRTFDQTPNPDVFQTQKIQLWGLLVTSYPESFDLTTTFNIKRSGD